MISALTMTWVDTDDSSFWLINRRIVVETLKKLFELIFFEEENSGQARWASTSQCHTQPLSSTRQFDTNASVINYLYAGLLKSFKLLMCQEWRTRLLEV